MTLNQQCFSSCANPSTTWKNILNPPIKNLSGFESERIPNPAGFPVRLCGGFFLFIFTGKETPRRRNRSGTFGFLSIAGGCNSIFFVILDTVEDKDKTEEPTVPYN